MESSYESLHGDKISELIKSHCLSRIEHEQGKAAFKIFRALSQAIQSGIDLMTLNEERTIESLKGLINESLEKNYMFDLSDKYRLDTELLELEAELPAMENSVEKNKKIVQQYLAENPPPADFIEKYSDFIPEYL